MKKSYFGTAVVAVAIGLSIATAAPAQANVWSCNTGYSSVGAYAKCNDAQNRSNDRYGVAVLCKNWVTQQSYVKYGNPVKVTMSSPSTVQACGAFENFYGSPWVKNW